MADTSVHRVTVAETARVRALRLEMLADSPLAFIETLAQAAARPHADFRRRIAQVAAGDERAQFVAELDGRLVGNAGGARWPEDLETPARSDADRLHGTGSTMIFAVYVTPSCRGTGVVGQLIGAVAAWSRAAGRPRLLLEVVCGNDRAIRAYQKLGFADTGQRHPHPTVPGLTEMVMVRAV